MNRYKTGYIKPQIITIRWIFRTQPESTGRGYTQKFADRQPISKASAILPRLLFG